MEQLHAFRPWSTLMCIVVFCIGLSIVPLVKSNYCEAEYEIACAQNGCLRCECDRRANFSNYGVRASQCLQGRCLQCEEERPTSVFRTHGAFHTIYHRVYHNLESRKQRLLTVSEGERRASIAQSEEKDWSLSWTNCSTQNVTICNPLLCQLCLPEMSRCAFLCQADYNCIIQCLRNDNMTSCLGCMDIELLWVRN